jgi:hypothetical protein
VELGLEVTGSCVRIAQCVAVLRNQKIVERSRNVLLEQFGTVAHDASSDGGVVEVDDVLDDVTDLRPNNWVSAEQQVLGKEAGQ